MTDTADRPRVAVPDGAVPKPLVLPGVMAAGTAALTGLLTCAAVGVTGWLAATLGGASAAVRAGAAVWLAAHKAAITLSGSTISLAPLGLSVVLAYFLYRAGRFAARASGASEPSEVVKVVGVLSVAYGAGALLVALLVSNDTVRVSPFSAFLGAISLALVAGTAGVTVESGTLTSVVKTTPHWVRQMIAGALAAVCTVFASASLLYVVAIVAHFSRFTTLLEALDAGVVGSAVLFAICVVLLPNAIVYAAAFIAGPGFQLGVGTTVAPTGVEVGNLPALPLLAAVPADGATPTYLLSLTGVVPLLAGVAAGLVVARRVSGGPDADVVGWDAYALRAALSGPLAGFLLWVSFLLASGSAGPGRMASFGVPAAFVGAGVMAAGVAVGAAISAGVIGVRRTR